MPLWNDDGSINVTVVDGTSFVGFYAADGSMNIQAAPGTGYCGLYSPAGCYYYTVATPGTHRGFYAPDGSLYVSTTQTNDGPLFVTGLGSGSFTMPTTAAFTIDALHFSHDETSATGNGVATVTIDKFPTGLGTVTASGPDAASVVYSLPESTTTNPQVAGWGINASTGQLSLEDDQKMRDLASGNTRTFKVRGSYGGTDHDTTVTVTLDLSVLDFPMPGLSYAVGHGVIRPVTKTIAIDGVPAGWALWTADPWYGIYAQRLYPLADGASIVDYDLRGYQVETYGTPGGIRNDLFIENCIFDHFIAQPQGVNHPPVVRFSGTNCTIRYSSFLCDGRNYPWNQNALNMNSIGGLSEYNRFVQVQNDWVNGQAGSHQYNYVSCALSNNREANGVDFVDVPINVTGSVNNPGNLAADGTFVLNGATVNVTTGQTRAQVRDAINAAALPNITATLNGSTENLRISYNPGMDALGDPLDDFVVAGTALTHFGITAGTYVVSEWGNYWLHGDGGQWFNINGDVTVHRNWIDCRFFGRDLDNNFVLAGRTAAIFFQGPLTTPMDGNLVATENYAFGAVQHLHGTGGTQPKTGTIALSAASATVTGTGTTFLADFGLSGAGAPSTSNGNDKFYCREGAAAGMVFTVTNVASNTSLTLSAVAGVTVSGIKMWKGLRINGITKYKSNRFGGINNVSQYYSPPRWASQYQDNKYARAGTYLGIGGGVKAKGDPFGPTLNPELTAPDLTVVDAGTTWVKFGWTAQTDSRLYVRHRTTSGPGLWSGYTLISSTLPIYAPGGFVAGTQYDFEGYLENHNTSFATLGISGYTGVSGPCVIDGSTTKLVADSAATLISYTLPASSSRDAITTAYGSASTTAGNTLSDFTLDMLDDFVETLQAGAGSGDLFTKLDTLVIPALGQITGKINLVTPGTFDLVEVGSGFWQTTAPAGYRSNTASATNTSNFCYFAGYKGYYDAGNKLDQDSASFGVYVTEPGNANNYRDMGNNTATLCLFNFGYDMIGKFHAVTQDTLADAMGPNSDYTSGNDPKRRGIHMVTRESSSGWYGSLLRQDGTAEITSTTISRTSSASPPNSIFALGGNNDDTTGANPTVMGIGTTNRHGMAFAGSKLTAAERDLLRDATVTFFTALNLIS